MKPWDSWISNSTNQFGQQQNYGLSEKERSDIDKQVASQQKSQAKLEYQMDRMRSKGINPYTKVPSGRG